MASEIDPTKFDESLESALLHARSTDEETMSDFLYATAHVTGEGAERKTYYRRFAAAASWLEAEPDTLLKAQDGVTFSDPARAIASLRARQYEMDVRLGIILAITSKPKFTSIFAGTSR